MTGLAQEQQVSSRRKVVRSLFSWRNQVSSSTLNRPLALGRLYHQLKCRMRALSDLPKVLFFYSHTYRLEKLIVGLAELGSFQSGEFTLASGKRSSIYVDLRLLVSKPRLMQEAAKVYAKELKKLDCDLVAGIPYAALPIGAAVSLESGIPLIYNRKESKSYGLRRNMEGKWSKGERVVIIEDVITTGGSIVNSVKLFRSVGLVVEDAIVLLDRQQGGVENLRRAGIRVHSVLALDEVLSLLSKKGHIPEELCR